MQKDSFNLFVHSQIYDDSNPFFSQNVFV